jgi:hypothetical protein
MEAPGFSGMYFTDVKISRHSRQNLDSSWVRKVGRGKRLRLYRAFRKELYNFEGFI